MAKGALAAGYAAQQQGGGGRRGSSNSNVGFADLALRAGEIAERRNIRETTAQKEFTDARNAFSKEQEEMYGAIAYEDQFDDTGITDIDEAGNKLGNVLKSEFEMTKMLFSMGKIDESEVRRRNTRMKGQVKNLKSGVYDKITTFKSELDAKVQAGTDSEADHMKLRQLERMTQNVAFGVDASGNIELRLPPKADDPSKASRVPTSMDSKVVDGKIVMGETKYETIDNTGTGQDSTIRDAQGNKTGVDLTKATVMTMSQFSTGILQNEPGVNLNTITDRLRGLETFGDVYRAGSREYKRYTSPDGKGERKLGPAQDALMQGAIDGMSQTEKLDALKKIGGDFDKIGITDDDVLGYDKDKEAKVDEILKEGLNNKLMNELRAMESSKPYEDPADKAARVKGATKDQVVTTAFISEEMAGNDGLGRRIQYSPTEGKGIQIAGITKDDAFMRSLQSKLDITTQEQIYSGAIIDGVDVAQSARIVGATDYDVLGEFEVEYVYTLPNTENDEGDLIKGEQRLIKQRYTNIEDINKFRSAMGLKVMSSKEHYARSGQNPPASTSNFGRFNAKK
tara:strand:+ start:3227 stop:4927 length:1701 start_codon:yes stop_codon:yes gene_type:complete